MDHGQRYIYIRAKNAIGRIKPGDTVIIDIQANPVPGCVVACWPDFHLDIFKYNDRLQIVGKVIRFVCDPVRDEKFALERIV